MSRKSTKIIKITLIILGSFLALDLLLVGLFFVPSIQNRVVNMVTRSLSETLKSEIHIGNVYITPTLKAKINDFAIRDHHGNDMIAAEKLETRITALRLSPIHLGFGTIEGNRVKVIIRKYKGEKSVNISVWVHNIPKSKNPHPFRMNAKSIILHNTYFLYANDAQKLADNQGKMDYAFFEIKNIEWKLNNFALVGSDISADFEQMAFQQYSGFRLMNLVCQFHICSHGLSMKDATLITPTSRMFMDLAFDYQKWQDLGDFLDKVSLDVTIRPSTFDTRDIGYFVAQAAGMNNSIAFQGHVTGPVNDLKIENLDARLGENTHLLGRLAIKNITDILHADIHARLEQTAINWTDIQQMKMPGGKELSLPDFLRNIGTVTADIACDGVISKQFTANAKLAMAAGTLTAKLETTPQVNNNGMNYVADVQSPHINIRQILPGNRLLGNTALHVNAKGRINDIQNWAQTLTANITVKIPSLAIKGYPLKNIYAKGAYRHKQFQAEAAIRDKNCSLAISGNVNLSQKDKEYALEASIDSILPNRIFAYSGPVDSSTTDGIEKFIRYTKLHPDLALSCQTVECSLTGPTLKKSVGNIFINNIEYRQDGKTVQDDRLRLIIIPQNDSQTIRFTSHLLNATLTTNHELKEIPNRLIDMAYDYCGHLLPARENEMTKPHEEQLTHFFDLEATAYRLDPVLNMCLPGIHIGENSIVQIRVNDQHTDDRISVKIPDFSIKNTVGLNNFTLTGNRNASDEMAIEASVDNISIGNNENIAFNNITLQSMVGNNHLKYDIEWQNPAMISKHRSLLKGEVDFPYEKHIALHFSKSEIYIKELPMSIDANNSIVIHDGVMNIDNVVLSTANSRVYLDGCIGNNRDSLIAIIDNLDIDMVNQILQSEAMTLNGKLTSKMQLRTYKGSTVVFGTAFIKEFFFNGENFGDFYANAFIPTNHNSILFHGGLIHSHALPVHAGPDNYNYKEFKAQKEKEVVLNGKFDIEKKELRVTADIDTLRLGFLEPILASFSHRFQGNASGKIDFVMNKDSMYFDGKALIRRATMGIASLNTIYNITNQTIDFNKKGFAFNNMDLTDRYGNHATLNGYIHHDKFKNIDLNLAINTPKILVLNIKRSNESPFYGIGFVSGDVAIYGTTEKLHFYGDNLATESGTVFGVPISFADKVAESDVISFKVADTSRTTNLDVAEEEEEGRKKVPKSNMKMDFDFTFNVTPAADIKLDLDLSAFGGNIKTKGEGLLHFTYDTQSDIQLLGNVKLQKGSFMMNFANLINRKFELMPGGLVTFGGSLNDININVQAQHSVTASLSDVLGTENINSRKMPVKTYLNFNGNLSDPAAIDFTFDLPNATNDLKTLFYSTIDTTNLQRKTEQFFSLVMLGKFSSSETSTDINIENTGIDLLGNTLSNFISQQLKVVDVNLNYQNATADQAAQYSVGASTSLFNDRTTIEGYFGYMDNPDQGNLNSQFIGDFSVEQKLNELGTWRLKIFNVTNQDELRNSTRNTPYAQGIAIIYQQDFNNRKDLIASFKRNKKTKIKKRNSTKTDEQ